MATMRMYCPSLKKNVEATITDGKRVASKGGSLRNIIYGEYEGRKCLPKTVKGTVFAQHGFGAESEGESATYEPSQEPDMETPSMEPTNASFSVEGDWCPECNRDWKHLLKEGHGPDCSLAAETESFCSSCGSHKRAEGCGCMAAESSPSSFDISWEDAQGVSSPSLPPEGIHFAEDEPRALILYPIVWKTNKDLPEGVFISSYDEETLKGYGDEDIQDYLYERFGDYAESYKLEYEGGNFNPSAFDMMKRFPAKFGNWGKEYGAEQEGECEVCFAKNDGTGNLTQCNRCEKQICLGDMDACSSICGECGTYCCDDCLMSNENCANCDASYRAEQGKNIKFCNGCNKRTNFEDGECNFCAFPEFGAEGDYHLNGETCEHCAEEMQLNAEGFCSECYEDLYLSETMAAEGISRNGKLVLGLTALGVGMAMALGSERVASLLDKLNRK